MWDSVNLFNSSIFACVENLAEYACAWLLVLGQDLAAEKGVAEGGLSSVEIAGDQDFT